MQTITVTPRGYALGAEITGIDLREPLSDAARQQIMDAWHKHLVLVFPKQELTPEQRKAFEVMKPKPADVTLDMLKVGPKPEAK